ncbi:MAG: anthranilate synthase component I [Halolamina sp.]
MSDAETPLNRSRGEFVELAESVEGPAVVRVAADIDDEVAPLPAYAALADRSAYGFLLESAEKVASSDPAGAFAPETGEADRHARYSFVGYDPAAVVSVYPDRTEVEALSGGVGAAADRLVAGVEAVEGGGDPDGDVLDRLRGALPDVERAGFPDADRQLLQGGLVGFLAYDAVYDLWLSEVGVERPEPVVPDAEFVLTTKTLVFDEEDGSAQLVFTPVVGGDADPAAVYDDLEGEAADVAATLRAADDPDPGGFAPAVERAGSREAYEAAVRETKQHVLDGDVYQGVVSRTRERRGRLDPQGLYASLRAVNPSPYMYLLRHGDRHVVGASPETLVSVQDRTVVSNPIAGTCARGESPVEDRRLAGELLADDKERAEHTMLVDLARNDVRRVSEPGSVRVEEFMNVLKYSHVQHIESTVTGQMAPENDAFDATRATFPAGTLTGAPKVRAMEIINDLEPEPRGVYGGGVGYYGWTGDADFAIVIRTATVERGAAGDVGGAASDVDPDTDASDTVCVRAGAGIVADSDPAAEYDETEQKMRGVLDALDRIEDPTDRSTAADGGDGA